jgi:hypothetical protein
VADGNKPPKSAAMQRLDELEKKLPRMANDGPYTFDRADRNLILKLRGADWLVYAARVDGPDKRECDELLKRLVALRERVRLPEAFGVKSDA